MAAPNGSTDEREQRLHEVLLAYLEAVEGGSTPDRQQLLSRHPDLAAELTTFFQEQDELESWTAPLRAVAEAARGEELTGASPRTPSDCLAPREPAPGQSFDDYELIEVIGRGGMGVIYKARQRSLNRLVALKIVSRQETAVDSQRFRNEAEIVATLDHPHIVPIHDVGQQQGQLYFSMKLIDGSSLAEQLDRFTGDPRGAARLLAQAARAVHHAHQRGVLHRDLKPANILLDREGQPHVTDFGLARRLEVDSSLTQSGTLVGTPSYMAPEQTRGQKGAVTTATDVYGLGAVLYTLLAGKAPFRGETVMETLEQVREREPEPPRRNNAQVDRDLETICLKCLQKEPQRRYESAQMLAEDLERWLGGEPIRARRAMTWERLRKWVRRRRALAALVIVTGLTLVGFVAGLVWHNAQLEKAAEREHQAAEGERQQAEDARIQRDLAREQRQWAREAVNDMYTEVAEKWLQQQPRLQPKQRQFLEKALRYYQRFSQEPTTSPEEQWETAEAYRRVAAIRRTLGDHRQAMEAYRQAKAILEQLVAAFPSSAEYRNSLAGVHMHLGHALAQMGAHAEAEEVERKAVRLLEELVTEDPQTTAYRRALAEAQGNLGNVLSGGLGRFKEAEEAFTQALRRQQQLANELRPEPASQLDLQKTYQNLARLYHITQRPTETIEAFRKARELGEHLLPRQPGDLQTQVELAKACYGLGVVLSEAEGAKAEEPLRRAEGLLNKLVEQHPDVPEYPEILATIHNSLGNWLSDVGRNSEAEKAYRKALKIQEKMVRAFPQVPFYRQDVVQSCNNLTLFLRQAKRLAEARKVNQRAREAAEQLVKDFPKDRAFHKDLARCHQRLAELCQDAGEFRQAAQECRQAEEACPEDPDIRCGAAWVLATLPSDFCNPSHAVELAREAIQVARHIPYYWRTLGLAQYRAGDARGAVKSLEESVRLDKNAPSALLFLSMAHERLGNRQQARRCYEQAVGYMAKYRSKDDQLLHFRAEAAALLGIQEQQTKDKEDTKKK